MAKKQPKSKKYKKVNVPKIISPDDLEVCFDLAPEEAVKYLKKKGYAISDDWRETLDLFRQGIKTITGVAKLDVVQAALDDLAKAAEEGTPINQWSKRVRPLLESEGFLKGREAELPRRLNNIYRTNIQTAFAVGREKAMEEGKEDFPYFEVLFVNDVRQSATCKALQAEIAGKVFSLHDPAAKMYHPPFHFQCRDDEVTLNEAQVKRRGYKVIIDASKLKNRPAEGFDKSPSEPWQPDLSKYDKETVKMFKKEQRKKVA